MKLTRRGFLHLTGTVAAILPLPAVLSAQAYPARPVRVIVPYAAGGPNDTVARIVAQKLSERWGQSFFIENIPAGAGNVGTALAANAAPDGYTIVVVTSSFFINPGLYERIRYDPVKDFSPLTMIASAPHVLTVHPSFPARNVREFVAEVRAIRENTATRRRGSGSPHTSPANCSSCRSVLISCMCRSTVLRQQLL